MMNLAGRTTIRSDLPHAVGEEKAHIIAHLPDKGKGLLMVFFSLSTESCDEITAQTNS